jgi:hypothetical protein
MAPIECTKAYKRVMGFDHAKVDTASYILVNEKATKLPNGDTCSGTRTHVNLYDGNAGPGFDPDKTTYPLGTEKILSQKLKGYTEIPISQCPVAKAL